MSRATILIRPVNFHTGFQLREMGYETMVVCSLAVALVLSAQVASAQRPGGFGGGGFGGGAMLLGTPEVQKELNISDDQKTKLRELMSELRPAGGGRQPL